MSNEEIFSGKAIHYNNARPAYSEELLDALYSEYGFSPHSHIADIGSGTGIFTQQLLGRGSTVYGVEPNGDMRKAGEVRLRAYQNFVSVNGGAENTTLPDRSVDIITVAQALHWFSIEEFRRECLRILKPNGLIAIVYNLRENDKVNEAVNGVIVRRCDYKSGSFGSAYIEAVDKKVHDLFGSTFTEIRKNNPLVMDREKFLQYWLSRSYAPHAGEIAYEPFLSDLAAVFERYSKNDRITIGADSAAYLGKVHSV